MVAHSDQLPATCDGVYKVEDLLKAVKPVKLKEVNSKQKAYKSHRSVVHINKGTVHEITEEAAKKAADTGITITSEL